jgi:hypothetical protein
MFEDAKGRVEEGKVEAQGGTESSFSAAGVWRKKLVATFAKKGNRYCIILSVCDRVVLSGRVQQMSKIKCTMEAKQGDTNYRCKCERADGGDSLIVIIN